MLIAPIALLFSAASIFAQWVSPATSFADANDHRFHSYAPSFSMLQAPSGVWLICLGNSEENAPSFVLYNYGEDLDQPEVHFPANGFDESTKGFGNMCALDNGKLAFVANSKKLCIYDAIEKETIFADISDVDSEIRLAGLSGGRFAAMYGNSSGAQLKIYSSSGELELERNYVPDDKKDDERYIFSHICALPDGNFCLVMQISKKRAEVKSKKNAGDANAEKKPKIEGIPNSAVFENRRISFRNPSKKKPEYDLSSSCLLIFSDEFEFVKKSKTIESPCAGLLSRDKKIFALSVANPSKILLFDLNLNPENDPKYSKSKLPSTLKIARKSLDNFVFGEYEGGIAAFAIAEFSKNEEPEAIFYAWRDADEPMHTVSLVIPQNFKILQGMLSRDCAYILTSPQNENTAEFSEFKILKFNIR